MFLIPGQASSCLIPEGKYIYDNNYDNYVRAQMSEACSLMRAVRDVVGNSCLGP
jgi:hypothetical protein